MKIHEPALFKAHLFLALGLYLSLLMFVWVLLTGRDTGLEASVSGNIIKQVSGIILLVMSLFFIVFSKRISAREVLISGWPVWLLLLYLAASIIWSYEPNISLRRIIALFSMALTCCVLVRVYSARSLLTLIAQTIVFVAFIGLCYALVSDKTLTFGLSDRVVGFKGIFSDKNSAARVYAYGLLLLIGLGKYKTKSDIVCIAFLSLAIALSQSATAVVMVALGTSLMFLFRAFNGKQVQHNVLRFLVLIVLLVVAAFIIAEAYEFILSVLGRDPTLTNRSIIWSLIDPLIQNELILGYGYGAFWVSDAALPFLDRWGFIGNAHSGYREIMLHGGLVGIGLLLTLIFFQLTKAAKLYVSATFTNLSSLLLMMVIVQVVVNYIAYVIINHNSFDMFLYLIVYFIIANQHKGKAI